MQTRDAKMGSNLVQVSVIVIESGLFSPFAYDPTANLTHVSDDRKQVRSI
jgi:hypothetical protein